MFAFEHCVSIIKITPSFGPLVNLVQENIACLKCALFSYIIAPYCKLSRCQRQIIVFALLLTKVQHKYYSGSIISLMLAKSIDSPQNIFLFF